MSCECELCMRFVRRRVNGQARINSAIRCTIEYGVSGTMLFILFFLKLSIHPTASDCSAPTVRVIFPLVRHGRCYRTCLCAYGHLSPIVRRLCYPIAMAICLICIFGSARSSSSSLTKRQPNEMVEEAKNGNKICYRTCETNINSNRFDIMGIANDGVARVTLERIVSRLPFQNAVCIY